jgi:hypothetical protein
LIDTCVKPPTEQWASETAAAVERALHERGLDVAGSGESGAAELSAEQALAAAGLFYVSPRWSEARLRITERVCGDEDENFDDDVTMMMAE